MGKHFYTPMKKKDRKARRTNNRLRREADGRYETECKYLYRENRGCGDGFPFACKYESACRNKNKNPWEV